MKVASCRNTNDCGLEGLCVSEQPGLGGRAQNGIGNVEHLEMRMAQTGEYLDRTRQFSSSSGTTKEALRTKAGANHFAKKRGTHLFSFHGSL